LYTLEQLGWGPHFEPPAGEITEDLIPARVAEEQRGAYVLFAERGSLEATVTGRMMHGAAAREDYPAVGDWVLARKLPGEERAVIHRTLPRRTRLSRKVAGTKIDEQIIAANVDTVFLVSSLNAELNLRRIERYLSVIWESGAMPVIVLNKADLAEDAPMLLAGVEGIAPGVDLHTTSAATGEGVEALRRYLPVGKTTAFIGSSGVGKSSLVNRLLAGEVMAVSHISNYDKGRHTTTSRQMLAIPGGGLIIDTPGLREMGLWDSDAGLGMAFSDVEQLAGACAFSDCQHRAEPGCAIQAALDIGDLALDRFESYQKLQREQLFIESKKDPRLRQEQQRKWKQISKANRKHPKAPSRW
jgi:ribosome biogenesis GTPase